MSSSSDEALLLAAQRDAEAFAEFYRRHARPLAGFLARRARTGSVEERARRRLRMERLELADADLRAIEACDDATVALEGLPPDQRAAVHARVAQEQDYAAIAA